MKTSNKILIALGLGILLLIGGTQLLLYSSYRSGKIISAQQLHKERYVRYDLSAPSCLSISGVAWVNIIPSDTFHIEFPNESKQSDIGNKIDISTGPRKDLFEFSYRQSGDTLYVKGNVDRALHRPYVDRYYRADTKQVNIYCRNMKAIYIVNGQLYLQGTHAPSGEPSATITIDSSTLWIGDHKERDSDAAAKEFFRTLEIRSVNSVLVLNETAGIHHLQTRLDDYSELTDRQALLDSLIVSYDGNSRISLTGENLKKAQLMAH